jgi:hypothetical protein
VPRANDRRRRFIRSFVRFSSPPAFKGDALIVTARQLDDFRSTAESRRVHTGATTAEGGGELT